MRARGRRASTSSKTSGAASPRTSAVVALFSVALASTSLPRIARADQPTDATEARGADAADDAGEVGVVVGSAMLLATSLIGGIIMVRAGDRTMRNAGLTTATFGFAAAPMAAHVATGEAARGFAFSAIPLAMATANLTLVELNPDVIDEQGTPKTRVPLATFVTVGLLSSVVGVVDAMFATPRLASAPKYDDVSLFPSFDRGGGSLVVGGRF